MQKKTKNANKCTKKNKNTKAKAKGTYKKQNFKSQSVFGCKSKYLTSCKQIIQITSSKQEEHGTKTYPFYSNNDNDVTKNKWVQLGVTPPLTVE